MPLATLHPELYAEILGFLSSPHLRYNLKSCSYVNQEFRIFSQALLFENYTIDVPSEWGGLSRSMRALNGGFGPPVSNYIKVLTFRVQEGDGRQTMRLPISTRLVENLSSLRRLRLVATAGRDEYSSALSSNLFENLLLLVRGRVFDLQWRGRSKGTREIIRLNKLLEAAGRIGYLHVSSTPVAKLLATPGPPLSPTLLHFSSGNVEDPGVLPPPRLDLSNCRSVSLSFIRWSSLVTTAFLGLISTTLRDFHYEPRFSKSSEWISPSVISSLGVLQNFSFSFGFFNGFESSYSTAGLSWMLEAIPHLQKITTLKSIRVDTNDLPAAKWHVLPNIFQGLSDLGDAFQLLPSCKIIIYMDRTSIERQLDGSFGQSIKISNDLHECLNRSRDSNDIQIHFRSFVRVDPVRMLTAVVGLPREAILDH
ncbi:hypothetical protein DL96DRAFT_1710549 [Flagelloscypha sp. PMI_526]|nr:hypothetical protein DL96DRAFT_1710549 [Flagelloscypha sp. PMI_526]